MLIYSSFLMFVRFFCFSGINPLSILKNLAKDEVLLVACKLEL